MNRHLNDAEFEKAYQAMLYVRALKGWAYIKANFFLAIYQTTIDWRD